MSKELELAIELFDWERVNERCEVDIMTMVTDFISGKIDASELMDAIAYRCQVTMELAYKQGSKDAIDKYKPPTDGLRVLVDYKIDGKWFSQLRMFTEYEPLVISDFSKMAGSACTLMVNNVIEKYKNS
jgi:hypothetical protein